MARSKVLYSYDAKRFREAIRPSLVGNIARIEPSISSRAAVAAADWLEGLVTATVRATSLDDGEGNILANLRRGSRITGSRSLASLSLRIWTQPWLFAHEYGATIEPQDSQYLAIPIFHALRPDGTPKYRSPRSWNRYGSFVYTQKSTGRKFLAYKNKTTNKLYILYILVDSVDIPPRLGLNKMATRQLGSLLAVWGQIYLEEIGKTDIINLWGARP